ncbi:MAG: dockerin type I repeat-containing protein [Halanaerobiales bacterium]
MYEENIEHEQRKLKFGDVNNDGTINSTDSNHLLNHLIGNISLSQKEKIHADVNGDSSLDSMDLTTLIHYLLGKTEKFPVEN